MLKPVYGRVLLKLSGEILAGDRGFGVDPKIAKSLAGEVKSAKDLDVDIAVVIGGGNIIRGELAEVEGMDRVSADYLGMLATIINAITEVIIHGQAVNMISPSVVTAGQIMTGGSDAEAYEGCLVQVNNVSVDDPDLGNGEWSVTDGTNSVRVGDAWDYYFFPESL